MLSLIKNHRRLLRTHAPARIVRAQGIPASLVYRTGVRLRRRLDWSEYLRSRYERKFNLLRSLTCMFLYLRAYANHIFIKMPACGFAGMLASRFAVLHVSGFVDMQVCWLAGKRVYWYAGKLACMQAGLLVCRHAGKLAFRYAGKLVYMLAGLLVSHRTGMLTCLLTDLQSSQFYRYFFLAAQNALFFWLACLLVYMHAGILPCGLAGIPA